MESVIPRRRNVEIHNAGVIMLQRSILFRQKHQIRKKLKVRYYPLNFFIVVRSPFLLLSYLCKLSITARNFHLTL